MVLRSMPLLAPVPGALQLAPRRMGWCAWGWMMAMPPDAELSTSLPSVAARPLALLLPVWVEPFWRL